jgi:membrane protease YdiL (CAAX protease family)
MNTFAEQTGNLLDSVALLIAVACVVVWAWVLERWWRGQDVVAYQARLPVPWHLGDLAWIVLFYLTMEVGAFKLAGDLLGPGGMQAVGGSSADKSSAVHIISQLIAEGNAWVLLLCGISAIIVAPATEEFFFRVLLQGWLEALQHRWRRHVPTLRRLVPLGAGPIVLTSLVFARMHFRVDSPTYSAAFLVLLLALDGVAKVVSLVFAIVFLRWRAGATAADLGWAPQKLVGDVELGFTSFLAVAVPVYAMQAVLSARLPAYIAPDPIPLFFFAVALGFLYFRTHRIVPLIILHAIFNGASLAMATLGQ